MGRGWWWKKHPGAGRGPRREAGGLGQVTVDQSPSLPVISSSHPVTPHLRSHTKETAREKKIEKGLGEVQERLR